MSEVVIEIQKSVSEHVLFYSSLSVIDNDKIIVFSRHIVLLYYAKF
jgi:hypothetical protein